jgi:AAA+ ATPase superfamily predicted ATPase
LAGNLAQSLEYCTVKAKLLRRRKLFGRKKELDILEKIKTSDKSEFVAIYGRRRVGKTFLTREAFHNDFAFYATGIANITLRQQLSNFQRAMRKYHAGSPNITPKNWFAAFEQLEYLVSKSDSPKKVIFYFVCRPSPWCG